jgi:hypothetical protein
MKMRATPEQEQNVPSGYKVEYEKDPIAGTIGYLVPDDSGDGMASYGLPEQAPSSRMAGGVGGRKPYDLSMSLRAPEYTDAVAAMKATAGRSMPRVPINEGDDEEESVPLSMESALTQLPSVSQAAAPSVSKEKALPSLPSNLIQRLRAAQKRDAIEGSTSSLGRLLMATSAGFSGVPTAPALMQDYMAIEKERRGAGRRAFVEEQAVLEKEAETKRTEAEANRRLVETELKKKEEAGMNDPSSPTARLYQGVAMRMGIPPDIANRLTERSGKGLLEVFKVDEGGRLRAALQDTKQQQAIEIQKMREELAIELAKMDSGDRQAAIRSRELIAALKQQGESAAQIRSKVDEQRLDFQQDKEANARVEKLTKQLPPQLLNSTKNLKRVRAIVEANRGDIPGAGAAAGGIPTLFISQEGENLRQFVDNLKNDYAKERFGTSFTLNEQQRLEAALGSIGFGKTENQFLNGLQVLEEIVYGKAKKAFQGYDAKTVKTYFDRDGITIPGDPLYGPQGAIAQGKILLSKDGKRVALDPDADAEKIAEAKSKGWKEVNL